MGDIAENQLSEDAKLTFREISAELSALSGATWQSRYFRRPDLATDVDAAGALLFAPGRRDVVMCQHSRAANGLKNCFVTLISFRANGHTVATSNNWMAFQSMPGSEKCIHRGPVSELLKLHSKRIATIDDLITLETFEQFIAASDRKEQMQAEFDLARGLRGV